MEADTDKETHKHTDKHMTLWVLKSPLCYIEACSHYPPNKINSAVSYFAGLSKPHIDCVARMS